jgi:hypothetical protein
MNPGDDNFFARWSRRKQAVRTAETPAPDEEKPPPGAAAEIDAEGSDLPLPEIEPVDAEPPEPLPRLEDLTEKSDLTAFLRKGVPKALQNAALRKMWSLDPSIRDHIGLAEYAWDFNQPGSMAGFGPLETKEAAAEFLATMSRGVPADPGTAAATSDASEVPTAQVSTASSGQAATASPDEPAGASEPDRSAEPPQLAPDQLTVAASAPAPAEGSGPAESSPSSPRPRHGGAVPR